MSSDYDPYAQRPVDAGKKAGKTGQKKPGRSPEANAREIGALTGAARARAEIDRQRWHQAWPKPGQPLGGVEPGAWRGKDEETDETGCLPNLCPVRPLGYDGEHYYFVDTAGQIFNTGNALMGVERIQKLFAGHEDFLCWGWPARDKKGHVTGFKSEEVRRDLYAACRKRGPFSPTDMVRGRGAWRDDEGRLVLHCGEFLWYDGKLQDTGELGEHFYVRRPRSIEPWGEKVLEAENPAVEVMQALRTWNFERGDIDALMLFGWIGVSMLGGALDWRPSVFVTGDAGAGKSELVGRNGLLRAILGRGMVSTTNASEAGLYQLVGHDSLPIAIDEMEGDDNPEQARKIIKMARDAASGSVRIRGGSDHKGVEFQAQSTFMFSAISPPGIPPASLTRLAIVQLQKLKTSDGEPPKLSAADTIGPKLLRRLADGYTTFPNVYQGYREALREHGHDSRGQNTFGTFLACAHMMLGDEGLEALGLPFENLHWYGEQLAADAVAELADKRDSWEEFLVALMTMVIDLQEHGQRYTVAQVLHEYRQHDGWTVEKASRYLAAADIALIDRRGEKLGTWIAIPNQSRIIAKALRDTKFGSQDGQSNWRWGMQRAPDTIVHRKLPAGAGGRSTEGNRVTVAGRQERCLFVDIPAYIKHTKGE